MQKDTKRIEEILGHVTDAIKLVREEQLAGHDCGTLRHDLERGEHLLNQRLVALRDHNQRAEAKPAETAAPQSQPE